MLGFSTEIEGIEDVIEIKLSGKFYPFFNYFKI